VKITRLLLEARATGVKIGVHSRATAFDSVKAGSRWK